ncbi:EF-hand domain-containing protein [uncultured Desulfovibrio sp.]|uniref:EF-hand domain-containing protein n=1 Tax=Candidatus Desulfovibrio intestinavium TaxID=2838534 RepID=A0A9D2HMI1_9BACT|nr:EF-hand domain-containing protein [uncultured Desulfovibrio sp.]HJA78579.1 EF-hand domain-containing protein [Candidatus Desulfovibrio intestinavium]
MKRPVLSLAASLALSALVLAAPAAAMPGMGSGNDPHAAAAEKFAKMDADKDGCISEKEFCAAYPNMQKAAFAAIDTDKNGCISEKEWYGFAVDHARGRAGMPAPEGQQPAPAAPAGNDMPLVMPPAK